MKHFPVVGALLCAVSLVACGNPATTPPVSDAGSSPAVDAGSTASPDAGTTSPDAGTTGFAPGLQYNGSIAFERTSP
jgi:hypothetical protein